MLARLVALFAILAFAVVTTAASAHAARMGPGPGPDHAAHVGERMPAPEAVPAACDGEQPCGSTDSAPCDIVCAGLAALVTAPGADARRAAHADRHDLPSEAIHVSRAPGLTERPPKLRLF